MTTLGDRYELGESIGTGGMSDVYGADDTLLGRDVAVKMLKLDMARDTTFRERFRREAQNSARLNHPNIVSIYDTGETLIDGVSIPYIVMERIYGRTVRDIVRDDGPLAPDKAAELMAPVCNALQSSHDAGIIHRDVKPANIMVTNTGAVKVMDFGIAHALDDSTSAMTQTSAVIGTAQYLSPEQARGKAADGRSDVYALGCVLYETVTGSVPFEGETPFAVAYQHVQEDPQPPSERMDLDAMTPTAAVNIDAVVLTAMAKHPADRYQSAAEMSDDLGRLARGAVTQAANSHVEAPATTETRVVTAAGASAHTAEKKRNWPKWIAIILGVIALIAIGAFVWDFTSSSTNDEDQTEQTQEQPDPEMILLPDVTNWEQADAVAHLEELGFEVDVQEEPNPEVERGRVISLNPAAGSELRAGTTVTLSVSSGAEITDVPDITNMTPQQASNALSAAGLVLNSQVMEESSDTVPQGQILSQDPAAGSQISMGAGVTITVSTGPELVRIPSVTGMQVAEAETTLSSLDLTPEVQYVDSSSPEGEVLSAEGQGGEVPVGSTVLLQVSNGAIMEMPNITRMTEQEALQALRNAGWTGSNSQLTVGEPVATADIRDVGQIAAATPQEGSELRVDQPVTIRLWELSLDAFTP